MGERHQGHKVRKMETGPKARPDESQRDGLIGFAYRGNSASSVRASAEARSLKKASGNSTHLHITAGHTPQPGADPDSFLPRLQSGAGVIPQKKENSHDYSSSARHSVPGSV